MSKHPAGSGLNLKDERIYTHPVTGREVPSVTTVLPGLPGYIMEPWVAKSVAEVAVDHLGDWAPMNRAGALRYLKAESKTRRMAAAERGTRVHSYFEALCLGEPYLILDDEQDVLPYIPHLIGFLDDVKPTPLFVEQTVWNESVGYAGTADLIALIDGEVWLIDLKTGRVKPEAALQLSAYAHGESFMAHDDRFPHIDRTAVLHCTPDGWALIETENTADEWRVFVGMVEAWQWKTYKGEAVLLG